MSRNQNRMPDVPVPDFLGAICEIWFTVNYAAYHLAYTRVYLQTRSMQTPIDELQRDERSSRDMGQIDLIICRSHLGALLWELHHVFEALEVAIRRGKSEYPNESYFYSHERQLLFRTIGHLYAKRRVWVESRPSASCNVRVVC